MRRPLSPWHVSGTREEAVSAGFWSDSNLQAHQAQLSEFLNRHQLTALSAPTYAYYDPPWTPWFWRTNEVLVDIAAASPGPDGTAGLRRGPG
jgi:hypothetical protein